MVSNCGESISPWYHTAGSQSPRGNKLRGINVPVVSNSGESISLWYHTAGGHSCPRGVNSQQPLQCHKNKYGFIFYEWSAKLSIFERSSRSKNVFDFLWFILREVSFFEPIIHIAQQNCNQNWTFFNPLVSGPGSGRFIPKTGGRKSCWSFSLTSCTL